MTANPYVPDSKQKAKVRMLYDGCLANENHIKMYQVIKHLTKNGGYVTMPIVANYLGIGKGQASRLLKYWRGVDKPDNIEWKVGEEYPRVLWFYRDTKEFEPHEHTVDVGEPGDDVTDRISGLKSLNLMKNLDGVINDVKATPKSKAEGHPKQSING